MDAKTVKLVEVLQKTTYLAPADAAELLQASKRTVRNYIARINRELEGIAVVTSERGSGYHLDVLDPEALSELLGSGEGSKVPSTSSERVRYLLNDLLNRGDWVTLDSLSRVLFVSRTTLSEDLQEVERRLTAFGLKLCRKPYHGLRVEGSEQSIRLCLAAQALEQGGLASSISNLDDVVACLQDVSADTDVHVSSVAYQNLVVHIAVAISRIQNGCYVPMESAQLDDVRKSSVFGLAERIAGRISTRCGVRLPDEEIAYIAIHLAGRQTAPSCKGEGDHAENLVISDEVWSVAKEMLECVWETFRFDFRHDLELRMNLARHLVPLKVRLHYRMRMENPLLSDIKTRFSLAFSMAREGAGVIAEHFGSMPSDEEIGYLAFAFALAIERQQTGAPKKNILIVCASGAGSARLLEHRYREEFGAYLNRIETCDALSIDRIDFRHIDYVFTTVPLTAAVPVPVYEVSYFLDSAGAACVRDVLTAPVAGEVFCYFDRKLFFSGFPGGDKRAVLNAVIDRFLEIEDADDDFRDLVWQREELAPTSFGNRVAMPHPLRAVGARTVVFVAVTEEPISWDDDEVQVIVLVSVGRNRSDDLGAFYDVLGHLLGSESAIARLIAHPSFDVLAQEIQKIRDEQKEVAHG